MDMLKNADPGLCSKYKPSELGRRIKAHLNEARKYEIFEVKDLLRFAHLSLIFPGFTEDETIKSSLTGFGQGKGPKRFNDLASSWPPSLLTPFMRQLA
jgi:hypothetical protein